MPVPLFDTSTPPAGFVIERAAEVVEAARAVSANRMR